MKLKYFLMVVLFVAVSFVIIPDTFAEFQTVTLSKVKGVVEIIPPGAKEGSAGVMGMKLKEGDTVKTYDGSHAEIAFGDSGIIYVKPDSLLTVNTSQIKGDTTETITTLKSGEIKAKARKLARNSKFETRTPVSVAAVRGTTYVVRVTQDGATSVHVVEGMVELTSLLTGLGVTIDAAQFSTVDTRGEITDPAPDTEFVEVDLDAVKKMESDEQKQEDKVDSRSIQASQIEEQQKPASPE